MSQLLSFALGVLFGARIIARSMLVWQKLKKKRLRQIQIC